MAGARSMAGFWSGAILTRALAGGGDPVAVRAQPATPLTSLTVEGQRKADPCASSAPDAAIAADCAARRLQGAARAAQAAAQGEPETVAPDARSPDTAVG